MSYSPFPRSMIRRLLARLIPGKGSSEPRVYGPDAHSVRRTQISRGAQDVIRKLQQAGFKAFVVGGAVRDLLLGITPKDFDIATDATPEQVKPLFRRAFIIGRRFRLVHVLAGPETIEVSTFRARQTGDDAADEHGRLLSDNVFGSQAEDALRRDFTINALYFDPATEEVWDYVGGVADVRARRMRLIGDPVTRYREDPVRMLRAARLAAKLGLTIEKKTAAPIPSSRRCSRTCRRRGCSTRWKSCCCPATPLESVKSLREHGLHHGVLPLLDVIVEQPLGQRFIELALANTDERVRDGKSVTPAFLFATLLWHEVLATLERGQGARRAADAGAVRGDGQGARAAGAAAGDSAPLRGDHQGDLGAAAALRAALGPAPVSAARASALSRRLRFRAAALRQRRNGRRARGARRLVGALPARRRRPTATRCCAPTKARRKSAARAGAAASAAMRPSRPKRPASLRSRPESSGNS